MQTISLQVTPRTKEDKVNPLRRSGMIPAVYYGGKQKPLSLKVNLNLFNKIYRQTGKTKLIDLDMEGKKDDNKVLIHALQFHPISGKITHVDFIHVNLKEEVTAEIPLKFIGTAPAVKDLQGVLAASKHKLSVKCLPQDLVSEIEVDISSLVDFHVVLHVKDIKVPATLHIVDNAEDTVVTATPMKEEKEEAPVVAEVAIAEGTAAATEEANKVTESAKKKE